MKREVVTKCLRPLWGSLHLNLSLISCHVTTTFELLLTEVNKFSYCYLKRFGKLSCWLRCFVNLRTLDKSLLKWLPKFEQHLKRIGHDVHSINSFYVPEIRSLLSYESFEVNYVAFISVSFSSFLNIRKCASGMIYHSLWTGVNSGNMTMRVDGSRARLYELFVVIQNIRVVFNYFKLWVTVFLR